MSWKKNCKIIPDKLFQIPKEYLLPATHKGKVERLNYTTYESMSYESKSKKLIKTAYVYLPYDYSNQNKYNVFYLMHGGWRDETKVLGTSENPNEFKNAIDHAIEDRKMKPMIIVCPTYNNLSQKDSGDYHLAIILTNNYHNELVNDLIPAVESKYSTYAESISSENLVKSRNHRAFGGFSMGSVCTWHIFQYCLSYFRYFIPMSGNLTSNGNFMNSVVTSSGYGKNDFFIYAMSGTRDFAFSAFAYQIQEMLRVSNSCFIEANSENDGNLAFRIQKGGVHDDFYACQYMFNGLLWMWNDLD